MSQIAQPSQSSLQQSGEPATNSAAFCPWVRSPLWDLCGLGGGLGVLSVGVFVLYLLDERLWGQSYSGTATVIYGFLFGFPHLAATYYRVYVDRREVRAYWQVAFRVPMAIFAVVLLLVNFLPEAAPLMYSVWFHWQWWHIARQQYGVVRVYQRTQRTSRPEIDRRIDLAAMFMVPIWGLLSRSNQWFEASQTGKPSPFLDGPIWMVPVPHLVVAIAAVLSGATLVVFLGRQVQLIRSREFSLPKCLMILSGMATFAVAMVLIRDFNWGYLALSLWHSVQYIFFVWHYQNRKYRSTIDPEARLASYLAQPKNLWAYLAFLLAITFLVGGVLCQTLKSLGLTPLLFTVVLTLNLHHYWIDSVVWKTRKAAA